MKKADGKKSFNDNYQNLLNINEKLKSNEFTDVDGLVDLIEEATKSYDMCKEKLENIKKMVDVSMHKLEKNGDGV